MSRLAAVTVLAACVAGCGRRWPSASVVRRRALASKPRDIPPHRRCCLHLFDARRITRQQAGQRERVIDRHGRHPRAPRLHEGPVARRAPAKRSMAHGRTHLAACEAAAAGSRPPARRPPARRSRGSGRAALGAASSGSPRRREKTAVPSSHTVAPPVGVVAWGRAEGHQARARPAGVLREVGRQRHGRLLLGQGRAAGGVAWPSGD